MSRTHLDLFSGIGGFALAARWNGLETIAFSEIDPYAIRVLAKHWPDVPNLGDITRADFSPYTGRVWLLTGGFPCQGWSSAGLRRGWEDHRNLWPSMLAAIQVVGPSWVLGENVANFASMGLERCQDDLEAIGYRSTPFDIPACACGLQTVERHVWIVAENLPPGGPSRDSQEMDQDKQAQRKLNGGKTFDTSSRTFDRWPCNRPRVLGTRKGISNYVDRYGSIGNSIPPKVAAEIIRCMIEADNLFCPVRAGAEQTPPVA